MSVETRQSTSLSRAPRQRLSWLLRAGSVGVALAAAGVALVIVRSPLAPPPPAPPVLAQVPAFAAVRQDGTTVTEQSWAGSIWVADFIFTRGSSSGSAVAEKMMATVETASEGRLPELRLVTFTVDPDAAASERLTSHGERRQAGLDRWAFLSAPREALEAVSRGLLQTQVPGGGTDLDAVASSSSLVLIDRRLKVRGFYPSSEPGAVEKLLRDAEALARLP